MEDPKRYVAVRNKARDVIQMAMDMYGVNISKTPITFALKGRIAGLAICQECDSGNKYSLRFNRQVIQSDNYEDVLNETVPHEVAHLVCFANPMLGDGHDAGWRRVCLALGGNGNTRHQYDVKVRGLWDYITDKGNKVTLNRKHHNYVQKGNSLACVNGLGKVDKWCLFTGNGHPMPKSSPNGSRPGVVQKAAAATAHWTPATDMAASDRSVQQPVVTPADTDNTDPQWWDDMLNSMS